MPHSFRFLRRGGRIPLGIKLIVLVVFIRAFGWGMIDPYFSIFVGSFTDSYTKIGLLMGIYSFVALLMVIPLIRLADRVKDARIFEDGQILYLFALTSLIMAGLYKSIILLIIGLILMGLGHPLVMVGSQAYIRKHDRSKKGVRGFGYYTALDYAGWIMGMVLGAFTVQYYGLNYMFLALIPSIIAGFIILPRIREKGIGSLFSGFRHYFHRKEDLTDIIRDLKGMNPKTFFFLLLSFFDGVLIMYLLVFIPLFGLSVGLDMGQIALLMALMYVPFVFTFLFSQIAERMRRMDVIAAGLFIGASAFILLAFVANHLWIAILTAMTSLALAIIRPAYNGMLTHLTPRRMLGEITGVNNFAQRIGYIVGPIFAGAVSDVYGIQITFLAIAVFSLILGVMTFLLRGYEFALGGEVAISAPIVKMEV